MTTSTSVQGFECGYDFFGRDPVDWHEDIGWHVWFSSPVEAWDATRLAQVAAVIGAASRAPGFVTTPKVRFDGSWALIEAEIDGARAFAAMRDALDAVHALVPIERVFVSGIEMVSADERAHWERVGRLPDFGDGPVAPEDWMVEGVHAAERFDPQPSARFAAAVEAWQQTSGNAEREAALASGELCFVPVPTPPLLAWDERAAALSLGNFYVPTSHGCIGRRFEMDPTPERPLHAIPQEIVIEYDGVVHTFTRPSNDNLAFGAPSPSGRRCLYTSKPVLQQPTIVEASLEDGSCVEIFRSAPAQMNPGQTVHCAAYLDSDDWVVLSTRGNLPKRVDSLELWQRTATGFVRVDDVQLGAANLRTSGPYVVAEEKRRVTVFGRVEHSLVKLGTTPVPPGAPDILRAGLDGAFFLTDPPRKVCLELLNHPAKLAKAKRPKARKGTLRLVAVPIEPLLRMAPSDLSASCRETQSGPGHYWARDAAGITVWRGEERLQVTPPAEVWYPTMSVHPDGSKAVFGLRGELCAEFDAASGSWRTLRTTEGRPFYMRVDGVDLLAVAGPSELRVFRGDEVEPVASLPQTASDSGPDAVVASDGHLYVLARTDGKFHFVDQGQLVVPGSRLSGGAISGRTEDGKGFVFVQTERPFGEYCVVASS